MTVNEAPHKRGRKYPRPALLGDRGGDLITGFATKKACCKEEGDQLFCVRRAEDEERWAEIAPEEM